LNDSAFHIENHTGQKEMAHFSSAEIKVQLSLDNFDVQKYYFPEIKGKLKHSQMMEN
jgi:hypothetical protein